ncbi:MAG: hypothetical protein V1690_01415 [Candidatus Moraniibacteriota bacterium]
MAHIGIITSGGAFALELVKTVVEGIRKEDIPDSTISFVFCGREEGETRQGDGILRYVSGAGLKLINFSTLGFKKKLREQDIEEWRLLHDKRLMEILPETDFDLELGWMWWFGKPICLVRTMVNLHPAKPGGPKGTSIEVIWQLIRERALETGIMMHLTTEDRDNGPVISFCRFLIRGQKFDPLWEKMNNLRKTESFEKIMERERENNSLFKMIRQAGMAREPDMVLWTAKALAEGEIRIKSRQVYGPDGKILTGGYDLTQEIEFEHI